MAIYYIDYVNGNDANSGVSWAQAWQTIKNGATAARIAPGDELRIAKSPDPVQTADNWIWGGGRHYVLAPSTNIGTGTDGPTRRLVKLSTDGTTIDWSVVTASSLTTTTTYYRGVATSALQFTLSTNTTSAQVCWNTPSTMDLSGTNAITAYMRLATTAFDGRTTNNMPELRLYDGPDLSGNLRATLKLGKCYMPNGMSHGLTFRKDDGTTLPTEVRSIGLFTPSSMTAQSVVFDHMLAVHDGHVPTYDMVFSAYDTVDNDYIGWFSPTKYEYSGGESGWRIWMSSRGVGDNTNPAPTAFTINTCNWFGATALPTYIRKTVYLPTSVQTTTQTGTTEATNEAGSAAAQNTISGGWNTTTTVRDGETWVYHFRNNLAYGLSINHTGWRIKNYSTLGTSGAGLYIATGCEPYEIDNVSSVYSGWGLVVMGNPVFPKLPNETTNWRFHSLTQMVVRASTHDGGFTVSERADSMGGSTYGFEYEVKNNTVTQHLTMTGSLDLPITGRGLVKLKYNEPAMWSLRLNNCDVMLHNVPISNTQYSTAFWLVEAGYISQYRSDSPGVFLPSGASTTNNLKFIGENTVIDLRTWYRAATYEAKFGGTTTFINTNIPATVEVQTLTSYNGTNSDNLRYWVFKDFDQTPGYHKVAFIGSPGATSIMDSVTTPVRTGSTAWRIFPTGGDANGVGTARVYPVAKAYVVSGKQVTCSIYTRKNATLTNARMALSVSPHNAPGVLTSPVTSDVKPSATDTWELKTLTFTPTGSGYFTLWLSFYGEGTASQYLYWDDLTITQAD